MPILQLCLCLLMIYKARQHLLAIDSLQLCVGKVAVKIVVKASGLLSLERRIQGRDHINMCLFHVAEPLVHVEILWRSRRLSESARGPQGWFCDKSRYHHVDVNKRNLPIEAFQTFDAAHVQERLSSQFSRLTTMAATE